MSAPTELEHRNWFVWIVRKVALAALGILIYCICINMFAGYSTLAVTWIAIAAVSTLALFVWIRDEQRSHNE